ncbi:MAG: methyltransferase domain-containing protein [Lachnospiraceae bacterium]|nr:methyltransferase domain-containing protein [Lachnospiraceae bacterium]
MTGEQYKELSIREFTAAAKRYEGNHAGVYALCRKDYPDILEELEKEDFYNLLDAGCGPAPMISLLSEKYPEKHYTGLDLTPLMIETAREKQIPNAEFVVGDCEDMPFAAESFDAVICSMSFHHYPDPLAFFREVRRCLKPGGRLILRDMTGPDWVVWLMNHLEMPLAHLSGHGDYRGYTLADIRVLGEQAGLKPEKVEHRKGFRLHAVLRKP